MEGVQSPDDLTWVVGLAGASMLYMAWGIGANDVANAFGPAFGAKSVSIREACVIAAFCEASGAIFMGGTVSDTIRKGMMSVKLYKGDEGRVLVMVGMTSVLIAAATWLLVASKLGLPVSTTHSAVGGVIAFAITSKGYDSVKWEKVLMIVASWFISPVMSAVLSGILYTLIDRLILRHADSNRRAKLAAPIFVSMISFVVALFTIYKGGKGLGLHKTSPAVAIGISAGVSVLLGLLSYPFVGWWARKCEANMTKQEEAEATSVPSTPGNSEVPCEVAKGDPEAQAEQPEDQQPTTVDEIEVAVKAIEIPQDPKEVARTAQTEQLFTGFVVIIAGFFSLAHGANDVANSVGPFGAVLSAYEGELKKKSEIPIWVFIASGFMIVVGLATYGVHVMKTLGTKITAMTPSRAFCVNFASTIVVLIATRAGIPVSTTHASVGAVLGVGIAQGARSVQWKVLVKVFLSWILTLPIVGVTAMGVFALFLPTVVNTPFK